jgi:O-antigen/teichoic acid export membrane protein
LDESILRRVDKLQLRPIEMKGRLKQLGRDSLVYGLGGIIARGIGFFLLPVYTRLFTPAEYGTIEMLAVLNSFLASILIMGMDSAQSFYFFEQKKLGQKAQARVVTAIVQWRATYGVGIVLLATLISPILNRYFFNSRLSWEYFIIAFAGALFAQVMSQSAEVYRLLYRPWSYISITLLDTLSSAGIAITLIVFMRLSILGFFIGVLSGSVVAASLGWWRIKSYIDFSEWHTEWWPRLLRFGGPLVPAALAMYVLTTADRWFINHYHGEDVLGLYAVGAKFAMLIAVAVNTFRQGWWPVAMDSIHSEDGPALFRTIARLYIGLGSAFVVILTALSPYLVHWFTTPAYFTAYPIVGILSWYSIFYGFNLIAIAGIWKTEKTIWSPFLMGLAALLNIGMDFLLVPKYGAIGAAMATSIVFLIWNMMTIVVSERLWKLEYSFIALSLQISIGGLICYIVLIMHSQKEIFIHIALVAIMAIVPLVLLSFTRDHLGKAYRLLIRES